MLDKVKKEIQEAQDQIIIPFRLIVSYKKLTDF